MSEPKSWTTASGEKIPIDKMTDKHLLNAFRYLDRLERQVEREWKVASHCCATFSPDVSQYDEYDEFEALHLHEIGQRHESLRQMMSTLDREIQRRGLSVEGRNCEAGGS